MARRRPFELAIPPAERRVRSVLVALTASVVLHWAFIEVRMDRTPSARVAQDLAAATRGDEVRQIELPVYSPVPKKEPTVAPVAAAPKAVARQLLAEPPREIPQEKVPESPPPPPPTPPPVVAVAPPPARADTGGKAAPAQPAPSLLPTFSKGKLWVKPLPLPPAELAARLRGDNGRPHMNDDGTPFTPPMADSLVNRIVQHYLDSLATEITAEDKSLKDAPQWTVVIGGREFGLDRGNLRVGGVTVSGVVMGYIRGLSGQQISHYYESKPNDVLRRDLYEAGRRADNYTQFKKSIADIRARKQEEKDFERAQRTPAPPVTDNRATP